MKLALKAALPRMWELAGTQPTKGGILCVCTAGKSRTETCIGSFRVLDDCSV